MSQNLEKISIKFELRIILGLDFENFDEVRLRLKLN